MFFPEGQVRVFLYGQPVNMRLSFDGLYALAKHVMHQDPLSGHLFAFINRRATQIRVLYFDRSGLCVWAKRLEQGRLISNWAGMSSRGTTDFGTQHTTRIVFPLELPVRNCYTATEMYQSPGVFYENDWQCHSM